MKKIQVNTKSLRTYDSLIDNGLLDEIRVLAEKLKGARIVHVNATANGGGVAEILHSLVPLYKDLGIDCEWMVMDGNGWHSATLGMTGLRGTTTVPRPGSRRRFSL